MIFSQITTCVGVFWFFLYNNRLKCIHCLVLTWVGTCGVEVGQFYFYGLYVVGVTLQGEGQEWIRNYGLHGTAIKRETTIGQGATWFFGYFRLVSVVLHCISLVVGCCQQDVYLGFYTTCFGLF